MRNALLIPRGCLRSLTNNNIPTSSVLYMPSATPPEADLPSNLKTVNRCVFVVSPSAGEKINSKVPGPFITTSVDLY